MTYPMPTTYSGARGEQAAADFLERREFVIIARNWRRRECEIDIIARKRGVLYMVEVKYRHSDGAGSGLEYITAKKLKRMAYAANRWVEESSWRGDYRLAAIEVSGDDYRVTEFVDCIEL